MDWTASAIILLLMSLNKSFNVHGKRIERGAVGGVPSELNEFPFMTALGWTNNATKEVDFLCGGILIAPDFVLTAAHCVFYEGQLPDIIKIGGNNLTGTENEERTVKRHFIFPEYSSAHAYDDIAVLQLEKSSTKIPASLWVNSNLDTMHVIAIGYGTTQYAGSRTPILQKVKLVLMQEAECQPYFKRERKFPDGITDSHICAGDPEGKQDTCQGDSGGPLLVHQKFAVGIISSGQACAGIPPAVYTRIATYIDWIAGILKEHGYKKANKQFNIDKRKTKYSK